ncbi:MAG TPA: DUF4411 family protein [Cellvibrionaceae bacterium]|nr:DUF4411 family protein [Cellvibrionaceae bacterium]HMY37826.1 DUF4411 family protein [Marinagarivorans sp.]HNB02507.1 DUF4411 family protein [Nitrosomonas sp.]HMW46917.1 DUF4411 family protein [Cellvibrionaceae bacterium]HMW70825.1 DUF4411 family protein [Cellvibrionaceae bacterium]
MYLLDANTYIAAHNTYYAPDFCPAYWDWLDNQFSQGHVFSVNMVYQELAGKNDALSKWVKARKKHFLPENDDATQEHFKRIMEYVYALPHKNPANVASFAEGADPWLLAKALTVGATVVTQERLAPGNSFKIKIPNVCQHYTIDYIDSFQLLKNLRARFIIDSRS